MAPASAGVTEGRRIRSRVSSTASIAAGHGGALPRSSYADRRRAHAQDRHRRARRRRFGTGYPPPVRRTLPGPRRWKLGDAGGLDQFGVNLLRLAPGAWSSQRHWHTAEDEFVWVVEGEVVLVDDEGEQVLRAGDCAGFKAGAPNGHHIQNRSDAEAVLLEVGSRARTSDGCDYPDIDMIVGARRDRLPPPRRHALRDDAGRKATLMPKIDLDAGAAEHRLQLSASLQGHSAWAPTWRSWGTRRGSPTSGSTWCACRPASGRASATGTPRRTSSSRCWRARWCWSGTTAITCCGPATASAGRPAVANGHCLQNRSDRDAVYLEVGSRRPETDVCDYPDIDMVAGPREPPYRHRDDLYPENKCPARRASSVARRGSGRRMPATCAKGGCATAG